LYAGTQKKKEIAVIKGELYFVDNKKDLTKFG
jgi:hypothetical protein